MYIIVHHYDYVYYNIIIHPRMFLIHPFNITFLIFYLFYILEWKHMRCFFSQINLLRYIVLVTQFSLITKLVYFTFKLQSNLYIMGFKGHSMEPENVAFINSFPLYTDYNYITIH